MHSYSTSEGTFHSFRTVFSDEMTVSIFIMKCVNHRLHGTTSTVLMETGQSRR